MNSTMKLKTKRMSGKLRFLDTLRGLVDEISERNMVLNIDLDLLTGTERSLRLLGLPM